MKIITLILVLTLFNSILFSQTTVIKSFSYLDSLPIKADYISTSDNYIKYNSKITTVYNVKSDLHVDYSRDYKYAVGSNTIKLIKTKINYKTDSYYYVTYGAIDGPMTGFTIFEAKSSNEIVGQIYASSLIIPGNGFLYSISREGQNFETRRKYDLSNDKIIEEKQPFYSVNLKSYALKPITIYSDIELTNKLAMIPVNGLIEVILCKDSNSRSDIYLVRTSFGLIGWAKLKAGQYKSVDVEGLFYKGG